MNRLTLLALTTFIAIPINSMAKNVEENHAIIAPDCLIKNIKTNYKSLSSNEKISLILINSQGIDELLETKDKLRHKECGGFFDVTHEWNSYQITKESDFKATSFLKSYLPDTHNKATTYQITYPNAVNQLMNEVNPQAMWSRLSYFSSLYDRYGNSATGLQTANDIKAEVETLASKNGRNDVSVYLVQTPNYLQPSVVAKIGDGIGSAVVVGAHMDTLANSKPGADDDGTGTVAVLELARVLLTTGYRFQKPIYLIWYGVEELGLIGSQQVVNDFVQKGIPVEAVMQFDMTGYTTMTDSTMWLIDDYVNPNVNSFVESLIRTYIKVPVQHTRCGYACSDHASWYRKNYATVFPFESSMNGSNPYIHSSRDTMEKLSLAHMTNYTKLAVAFTVEIAEPIVIK